MNEPINDFEPAYPFEPAFPVPGGTFDPGNGGSGCGWGVQFGMSLRDWYAGRAPTEIPYWFEPSMPTPRPESEWVDEGGLPANGALNPQTLRSNVLSNSAAIDAWEREYARQRLAQWPWAYADLVLSARKAVKP